MPFSPKSSLSKEPLCHLIWIFVYSLAILAINYHFCHFRQCVHFWTYLENIWYYHLIDNVIFIIIFILLRSTPIVKIEDWNRIYRRHADIVEWQDQPFCRKNTRSATVKEQTNVLLREILVKTVWAWKCFKWIIEKILKSAIFVEFMQIVECYPPQLFVAENTLLHLHDTMLQRF